MEFLAIGDYLVNVSEIGSIEIVESKSPIEWRVDIKARVANEYGVCWLASVKCKSKDECKELMNKIEEKLKTSCIVHKI